MVAHNKLLNSITLQNFVRKYLKAILAGTFWGVASLRKTLGDFRSYNDEWNEYEIFYDLMEMITIFAF